MARTKRTASPLCHELIARRAQANTEFRALGHQDILDKRVKMGFAETPHNPIILDERANNAVIQHRVAIPERRGIFTRQNRRRRALDR